jgi:hypothetical protein
MKKDLQQEGSPEGREKTRLSLKEEAEKLLSKNGHEWCMMMADCLEKAAMEDYEFAMQEYYNEVHEGLENK